MNSAFEQAHAAFIRKKQEVRKMQIADLQKHFLMPNAAKAIETKKSIQRKQAISRKKARKQYKALVWKLTEEQDLSSVPNIGLRQWRKYDLDHIISIWDGFNKGLPPEAIASISNLRIIPHIENGLKGNKSEYQANPLSGLLIAGVL